MLFDYEIIKKFYEELPNKIGNVKSKSNQTRLEKSQLASSLQERH